MKFEYTSKLKRLNNAGKIMTISIILKHEEYFFALK